ncbi:TatD family hydrolase, partial [Candidatus Fermentibacterales bacterium]|nr:TatD family hydrolase [Candidatus Fermentibacterales bacterium]
MSITLEPAPEAAPRSLPSLDAHAHIDHRRPAAELGGTGAVLAMTQSLDEARDAVLRREPMIVWGAGCHPREILAQRGFDRERFRDLLERSAIAGEIGLDTGSKVPVDMQLSCFRQALEVLSDIPRFVSIHSYQATGMVLEELTRTPIAAPVMHWWTGGAAETSRAVDLGCYFSVHSQVARHTKFRTRVPPDRILLESDH